MQRCQTKEIEERAVDAVRADGSPACGAADGSPDLAMSTRNAVEIYDAQYARKQQMLAEPPA